MHRLPLLLSDGVARRATLTAAASSSSVDRWLRGGALVQLQPGVLALPERAGAWEVRAQAAMMWSGGVLSLSALAVAGLVAEPIGPLHVTVPLSRHPRGGSDVVVHRGPAAGHHPWRPSGRPRP